MGWEWTYLCVAYCLHLQATSQNGINGGLRRPENSGYGCVNQRLGRSIRGEVLGHLQDVSWALPLTVDERRKPILQGVYSIISGQEHYGFDAFEGERLEIVRDEALDT